MLMVVVMPAIAKVSPLYSIRSSMYTCCSLQQAALGRQETAPATRAAMAPAAAAAAGI